MLEKASADFDWSEISPTIFGAVFESTLNPETRRSGGMHYTSIENIHKVIDPLFLDDLKNELEGIQQITVQKTKDKKLREFQTKLANLRWLDPASGSGNFLTETYISIRRLENEVIKELQRGQISFGFDESSPIQVSIDQFYGIEINIDKLRLICYTYFITSETIIQVFRKQLRKVQLERNFGAVINAKTTGTECRQI